MSKPKDELDRKLDELFHDCREYEHGVAGSYEFDETKAIQDLKVLIQEEVTKARIDEAERHWRATMTENYSVWSAERFEVLEDKPKGKD